MTGRFGIIPAAIVLALTSGEWSPAEASGLVSNTAERLTVQLQPDVPLDLEIETTVDHQNLWDPAGGYTLPIRHGVFVQSLEIENTSHQILDRPWPVFNGYDLSTLDRLHRTLGFGAHISDNVRRWYGFWSGYRYHDSSRAKTGRQLFGMIHYWGYGFCGDDFAAQHQLFDSLGVKARRLPLNGHTAGEFFYQGQWHIVDGDKSAVYLELDNTTFASFDDIRHDPLLALRTKTDGRVGAWDATRAWGNASLFEYLNPEIGKELGVPSQALTAPGSMPWNLYPGEKLIFRYDKPPQKAVGKRQPDSMEWLATVEMVANLELRQRTHADGQRREPSNGSVEVTLPFPITEATYHSGEKIRPLGSDEPQFEITLDPTRSDQASIVGQVALRALPNPLKGRNRLAVRDGPVQLTLDWLRSPDIQPPPIVLIADRDFSYRPVIFSVNSPKSLTRVWWQISAYKDFRFVPPNWDNLLPYSEQFEVDPVSSSFFRSEGAYYLRARGFDGSLWSDWSEVKEISVVLPPQPTHVELDEADSNHRLSWTSEDAHDIQFMVFGSNRRDFLPETWSEVEVTELENLSRVLSSRPNRNLLGTTDQPHFSPSSPYRYYRVIAVKDQSYSAPSVLIHAKTGPTARVLQTRWEISQADNSLGYIDIYQSHEIELPNDIDPVLRHPKGTASAKRSLRPAP